MIDKNYKFLAEDIIKKYNFRQIPKFDLKKMVKLMKMDKKATSNSIVFILPTNYSIVDAFEIVPNDLLK